MEFIHLKLKSTFRKTNKMFTKLNIKAFLKFQQKNTIDNQLFI